MSEEQRQDPTGGIPTGGSPTGGSPAGGSPTGAGLPDAEMAERIARHRARRPQGWTTLEIGPGGDLESALRNVAGTVLVDSLGSWLAGCAGFVCDIPALVKILGERLGDTVVVTDEVGLGVHPSTGIGNAFRDALGQLNKSVADVADRVVLVVAGRVLELSPGDPG